ncbi:MAG: SRPBCC family protein [Acidimicrobiales bacterium]
MHRTITTDISAPISTVVKIVSELETYDSWLDIVERVEPANPDAHDEGPAYLVTMRAKVGPLARSKRLRMVRVNADESGARFERREIDGRDHAEWILNANVTGDATASSVTMDLRYEGGLWSAPLDAILGSHIDGAAARLDEFARSR